MKRAEQLAIDFARESVKKATYLPIERIEPGCQRDFLLACTASLADAFLAGYRAGLEEAAILAETHGYEFFFDKRHVPWAYEANMALRTQNHYVAAAVRALAEEEK